MRIDGTAFIHGPQAINGPHRSGPVSQPQSTSSLEQVDQLEISQSADLASRVFDVPAIRADRVAEIRAQIAAGTYETEAKLDSALDSLLDEFA